MEIGVKIICVLFLRPKNDSLEVHLDKSRESQMFLNCLIKRVCATYNMLLFKRDLLVSLTSCNFTIGFAFIFSQPVLTSTVQLT